MRGRTTGFPFPAAPGQVITFPKVIGQVTCGDGLWPYHGPDGGRGASGKTNVASWGGISGIVHRSQVMFLTGVFLTDAEPAGAGPARLRFANPENFTTLRPKVGQTFFIGDGRTDVGDQLQQFHAPANATRLYLGFADACNFGDPVSPTG